MNYAPAQISVTGSTFSSNPALTWTEVNGAAQYQVWVNNVSTGATAVVNNSSVQATTLAMNNLPAGTYRAWVRGRDLDGGSFYTWSQAFDFEIGRPPRVVSPVNTVQSVQPVISWTAVAGAVRYEIWLSNLTTGLRIASDSTLQSTSYSPTQSLVSGNSYRVWIRAFDSTGTSTAWSAAANFSVASNSFEESTLPDLLALNDLELEEIFALAEEWMHDSPATANESGSAQNGIAFDSERNAASSEIAESVAMVMSARSPERNLAKFLQLDAAVISVIGEKTALN